MTRTDKDERFEQVEKQYKCKKCRCRLCGKEGEYSKDISLPYVSTGEIGFAEGNSPKSIPKFICKDINACKKRREDKGQI